jgi:hypothetical protein
LIINVFIDQSYYELYDIVSLPQRYTNLASTAVLTDGWVPERWVSPVVVDAACGGAAGVGESCWELLVRRPLLAGEGIGAKALVYWCDPGYPQTVISPVQPPGGESHIGRIVKIY